MKELGVVCRCPAKWPIVWHNSGAYVFTPSPDDPSSLRKCSPVKHSLSDAVALASRRVKSFVQIGLVTVNVVGDRVFWKDGTFVSETHHQPAAVSSSAPVEKNVEVVNTSGIVREVRATPPAEQASAKPTTPPKYNAPCAFSTW